MISYLQSINVVDEILQSIMDETNPRSMSLRRSIRVPLLSTIAEKLNRPVLFITGNGPQALTVLDEYQFWSSERQAIPFSQNRILYFMKKPVGVLPHDRNVYRY